MNLGHAIGSAVRDAVREPDTPKGFWHQLGQETVEWVRTTVAEYDPIRFEEFSTREDERTCPICGQLDGFVWQEGDGFYPPLHDHCRCTREYLSLIHISEPTRPL